MISGKKVPGGSRGKGDHKGTDGIGGGPGDENSRKVGAVMKTDESGPPSGSGPSGRPRGRNQDILPGILGKQLRAAYGELLSSPVPDVFNELIRQLENQEPSAADKPKAGDKPPSGDGDGR